MPVSGVFFKCTKEIKGMKISLDEYINYIRNKSKATYLTGRLIGISLDIYDVNKNILGMAKIFKTCTKTNRKVFFDFVLWYENGQNINEVKKIDKDLVVYEVEFPILTMISYELRSEFDMKKNFYVNGKVPDFLSCGFSGYQEVDYVDIDPVIFEIIKLSYKNEFVSELINYRNKYYK